MVSSRAAAKARQYRVAKSTLKAHKQLTEVDKSQLVGMHFGGLSMHVISDQSGVPYETVRRTIENYQKRGTAERKSGSGRPRKTTHSDDLHMVLLIKRDRETTCTEVAQDLWQNFISASTVRRRLHENSDLSSHFKSKKPFIGPKNRRRRIKWCMARLGWTKAQWRRFMFSDESPFVLRFHGKTRIWRGPEERFCPFALTGTVKHDERINVWGCFAAHGVGNLYLIDGIMDQYQYHKILEEQLIPSAKKLFDNKNWTFQQDNDPKHTAKSTKRLVNRLGIPLEDWPSQSPDLNPIENLWAYLNHVTRKRKCNNKVELFNVLQEAWNAIPTDYLTRLADSMPERLNAVIDNKGYPTSY